MTHELQGTETASTVRFKDGNPVVTDGPFMEAKEVIGGYAIVDVADLGAALELTQNPAERSLIEARLADNQ
jgi:hypothetical protein